jgi:hypothetical protein
MNKLQSLAIACCAALASCSSFDTMIVSDNVNRGVQLAESNRDDGSSSVWRAYPGNNAKPRIELTAVSYNFVPKIGLRVVPVTRQRAEASGATPFRGVWVERVTNNLPADKAGIVRGDIVLRVDDVDVTSTEQFTDLILSRGVPDQPLSLTIHRKRRPGDAIDEDGSTTIAISPTGNKIRKSSTDSFPLEESKGVQAYTGMQMAIVTPDLAQKIYDIEESVALVTGVIAGSPAYYAGLRAGDRILKVDGESVHSIQDVRDAVLARVHNMQANAPMYDLAMHRKEPIADGGRSDDIQIEVDGPLGPHQATLGISASISNRSRFYIPIVVDYEAHAHQTDFGFLNFIFQFGFNYRSRVRPSATRAPVETSSLSILPLGMFQVHHGLTRSDYTLFWLIRFGSDR